MENAMLPAMSPADRRRVVLLAAEVGERYIRLLEARAKHNPSHDTRGRFARTGAGPHPRAHQSPRKVRGPEHATYLGHQAKGRREHARDIRRERRQLGREHATEEATLRRQGRRQAASLDRRQGRESARLDARHGRETAKAPDSRMLARRHAGERSELSAAHRQERNDLAGEIRSERRDLRDEHREAVRDQRHGHLEGIRDFRLGQRSDMAETLRDIRSQRQYERESRGESGKSLSSKHNPCHDPHSGQFCHIGGGNGRGEGGLLTSYAEARATSLAEHGGVPDAIRSVVESSRRIGEIPPRPKVKPGELKAAEKRIRAAVKEGRDPQAADVRLSNDVAAYYAGRAAVEFRQRSYVVYDPRHRHLFDGSDYDFHMIARPHWHVLRAFDREGREIHPPSDTEIYASLRDVEFRQGNRVKAGGGFGTAVATKDRDDPFPSPDDLLDEALDNIGLADAYRDDSLTPRQRLDLLHEVRLVSKAWFRREADTVLAEAAPADDGTTKALGGAVRSAVGSFFGKARGFLRSAIVAGTLALLGPEPLDDATLAGVERNVAVQVAYLDDFEAEVASGSGPLDGTFASRAEMYGAAAWGSAHDVLRAQAVDVFAEERRIHVGGDDPCHVCAAQQALGWQPIGTLRPIGESPCLTHCHCHFVYRDRDGAEYIAGRGPLDAAASGATG